MKIWLADEIGEAIRTCSARHRKLTGPELSCEADNLPRDEAKQALISSICEWQREILIGFFRVASGRRERVRACFVNIAELAPIVDAAVASEEVVSILDPSEMGGCTFDFSPDEDPNPDASVELLVTAWGTHEEMIEPLAERLKGVVFRQGQKAE